MDKRARESKKASLALALSIAKQVQKRCRGFRLWKHKDLLLHVLREMQVDEEKVDACCFYPSFLLQALDFTCRLLEHEGKQTPTELADYINVTFLGGKDLSKNEQHADAKTTKLFTALECGIVKEWKRRENPILRALWWFRHLVSHCRYLLARCWRRERSRSHYE